MGNKKEIWMRIPIFIVSGVILKVWGFFILIFALVQFILIFLEKKKEEEFSRMFNLFGEQLYCFIRYITFISEEKPFPFSGLKKGKR
ncbi:MAG: DUF4389 domain-containing protein [Candidatus Pacearchaeota archaeon]|nr:DUF4389 domain-containing protein [Candidatus Pacearchaeota archaeon]